MSIPKILHYCWFGKGEIPDTVKYLLSTWKKYCPDYEIKEWNEDNFDISQNLYMEEAYRMKKWAFVTDYARLKILYDYGGIYMDTDVEVLKSFDDLLQYDAFSGFESDEYIPTGTMGAVSHNEWIEMLLNDYKTRRFIKNDGSMDLTTNVITITRLTLGKYKIKLNGEKQIFGNNMILLPFDYLCAKSYQDKKIYRSNNTYTIHHFSGSWVTWDVKYKFDSSNRWAQMANMIPWSNLDEKYHDLFASVKSSFNPFRLILGILLLQDKYQYSNSEMVEQLTENHYYQYFCGVSQPSNVPKINEQLLIHFHKCCTNEKLLEIKYEISKIIPGSLKLLLDSPR